MIDLELYRIFYLVGEAGNITKASEKMHISQPAVSKHIQNLESLLGSQLFIRTKKGVKLTEVGENLFKNIKQALSIIDNMEQGLTSFKDLTVGTIKIGISTTLVRKYLITYIKHFHELYPNIIIEINTDPTEELIKLLKQGILDFVIAKLPIIDNELDYIKLGEIDNIFIVNEKYKELVDKELNIKDLLSYPILLQKEPSSSRKTIDNYCRSNNITIKPSMNIASSNLLIDFVKAGLGIGFVSKLYVDEELDKKVLFELRVLPKVEVTHFGIIKLKDVTLSFASKKFIDIIRK